MTCSLDISVPISIAWSCMYDVIDSSSTFLYGELTAANVDCSAFLNWSCNEKFLIRFLIINKINMSTFSISLPSLIRQDNRLVGVTIGVLGIGDREGEVGTEEGAGCSFEDKLSYEYIHVYRSTVVVWRINISTYQSIYAVLQPLDQRW